MNHVKFLLPSALGVYLFLFPVQGEHGLTIVFAEIMDAVIFLIDANAKLIIAVAMWIGAFLSTLVSIAPNQGTLNKPLVKIFDCTGISIAIRYVAAILSTLILARVGPEYLWSESTGWLFFSSYAVPVFVVMALSAAALPLLTGFGLIEFIGTLVDRFFRTLFKLPGSAAIGVLASWFGASITGLIIANEQFRKGDLTGREAATLGLNFCISSLPSCYLTAIILSIESRFLEMYSIVVIVGIILAMITPRIPPLSRLSNSLHPSLSDTNSPAKLEKTPEEAGTNIFVRAYRMGLRQAEVSPSPLVYTNMVLVTFAELLFSFMPYIFLLVTSGLIVATYTNTFYYIGMPLVPILEFLQVDAAQDAAAAIVTCFLDTFLPVLIGMSIESEQTRFIIGAMSIVQLIYLSAVGIYIIKSRIPVNFWTLAQLFVVRTTIALPLVVLGSRIYY